MRGPREAGGLHIIPAILATCRFSDSRRKLLPLSGVMSLTRDPLSTKACPRGVHRGTRSRAAFRQRTRRPRGAQVVRSGRSSSPISGEGMTKKRVLASIDRLRPTTVCRSESLSSSSWVPSAKWATISASVCGWRSPLSISSDYLSFVTKDSRTVTNGGSSPARAT